MTVQCAWCGLIMHSDNNGPLDNGPISHGICESCIPTVCSVLEERTGGDKPQQKDPTWN